MNLLEFIDLLIYTFILVCVILSFVVQITQAIKGKDEDNDRT